jgi:hypothetical protein
MARLSAHQARLLAEMAKAPGSARDLSVRTGLTEYQVRNAIDGIRRREGYEAIRHHDDGTFSLG